MQGARLLLCSFQLVRVRLTKLSYIVCCPDGWVNEQLVLLPNCDNMLTVLLIEAAFGHSSPLLPQQWP